MGVRTFLVQKLVHEIRQAKATGKDYTLGNSDGLSLGVSAAGSKSWHFRYSWVGKQKRMSLGAYPEVGLRQARALRDEARRLIAEGTNPCVHRRHKRQTLNLAEQNTFQAMYDLWFAHRALLLKKGRQSTLKQLLRFALVKAPGLEQNPASDLDVVAAPKPAVNHNPFLRMPALPGLLQAIHGYGGALQTRLGLRLLLLTGVRNGELRLATPEQFDLAQGLWIIPPEVVKQLQLEMRKEGRRGTDRGVFVCACQRTQSRKSSSGS